MGWFSKKSKDSSINKPEDMSPLEAVTHLCAAIQLADKQTDFEEREAWVHTIEELFPEFSEDRADRFLQEAYIIMNRKPESDRTHYIDSILHRIKTLLSFEQINLLEPKIKDLIEADGIVMTSEMEIAKQIESVLGITISINENL